MGLMIPGWYLDDEDEALAERLAIGRHEQNKGAGRGDTIMQPGTALLKPDILGIKGEIAHARIFEMDLDEDCSQPKREADFVLPSGATVNVKCTDSDGRVRLLVDEKVFARDPCQLYVLALLRGRLVRFLGGISREKMVSVGYLTKTAPRRPKTLAIETCNLIPLPLMAEYRGMTCRVVVDSTGQPGKWTHKTY